MPTLTTARREQDVSLTAEATSSSRSQGPLARSDGPDLRRVAAVFGIASVIFSLAQFPLYMQNDPSVSVYDGTSLVRDLYRVQNFAFTRILFDLGLYVSGMIFAAALSGLIKCARPAYDWVGSLLFGSFAIWIGVTLVANGLEGAAVLDTLRGSGDPSAVRALNEATLLIYNGSIAFAITGLFLGTAAYATFATGVLPAWTGWIATVGTVLCAASIPAMYGGPVDWNGIYNTGGWGPTLIANFPPVIWLLSVSIALLRGREQTTAGKLR